MLSLQKSKDATDIVGIYKGKKGYKRRKPTATAYFTHSDDTDHGNMAPAAGVLQLHRDAIKKELLMKRNIIAKGNAEAAKKEAIKKV